MNDAIVNDIIEPVGLKVSLKIWWIFLFLENKIKALTVPDIAEIRVAGVQLDEVAPVNMISR